MDREGKEEKVGRWITWKEKVYEHGQ